MSKKAAHFLKLHYRQLTAEEAPHLHETLERLSKKAGLAGVELHINTTQSPFISTLIGAVEAVDRKAVVLGSEALHVLGMEKPSEKVTLEIEAVLAHELGHLKNRDLSRLAGVKLANASPFLGMSAAVVALACIRHHNKKKKHEQHAHTDPMEDLSITNAKGEMHLPSHEEQKTPWGAAITLGKYLAAAALGLGAGVYGSRLIRHGMEFKADKFSAELMGDGKPLASALRKLGEHFETIETNIFKDTFHGLSDSQLKVLKKINAFAKSILHPNMDSRILSLEGMRL